jgi:hypothetical protein
MVLRYIAILLVVTALGAGLQYGMAAPHRTPDSVDLTANLYRESRVTVNHAHSLTQAMESPSVGASGDDSHIARIRRAHATIRDSAVSNQPPTF